VLPTSSVMYSHVTALIPYVPTSTHLERYSWSDEPSALFVAISGDYIMFVTLLQLCDPFFSINKDSITAQKVYQGAQALSTC
jgi:hypothetical protein